MAKMGFLTMQIGKLEQNSLNGGNITTRLERQKGNSENKQTSQNTVMNPEGRQDVKCQKDRYAHLQMSNNA